MVNFNTILYIILSIIYLAFNIYQKNKFTVLLFILIVLLYIVFYRIIIGKPDKNIRNKSIPYVLILAFIISYVFNHLSGFLSLENSKSVNGIDLYLPFDFKKKKKENLI